MDLYIITLHTVNGTEIRRNIVAPLNAVDFDEKLCAALDSGGAMLDTKDGTKLIINTAAIATIEIDGPYRGETASDTPR